MNVYVRSHGSRGSAATRMLWSDTFNLCVADHLRVADPFGRVDLIAWNNLGFGNGKRSRRCGDYLLVLQKAPVLAQATWRDDSIRSRWSEKIDKDTYPHPHAKPIGLIDSPDRAPLPSRAILANPDPAAGSLPLSCMRPGPVAAIHRLRTRVGSKPR